MSRISAVWGRADRWLPGSWMLLVLLWGLLLIKQVEGISTFVFSYPLKVISSLVFIACFGATIWSALEEPRPSLAAADAWWVPLVGGILIMGMLAFLPSHFAHLGYRIEVASLLGVANSFALVALFGWLQRANLAKGKLLPLLLACWLASTVVWFVPVRSFPLNGDRSDMLPSIISGCRAWLAGESPYQWFDVGTHRSPMVYLPALWMCYLPCALFEIDPRWLTPVAQLGFLLISWLAWNRHGRNTEGGIYLAWVAANPLLFLRHELHASVVWPVLALALLFMLDKRWLSSAAVWGVLVAMRLTLWVLVPFFLVYLYQRCGWRRAALASSIVLGVAALFVLPFFATNPPEFVDCVFTYRVSVGSQMASAPWRQIAEWQSGFSLVPLFARASAVNVLRPLQFLSILLLGLFCLWRRPGLFHTLLIMSVALLAFLLLNPLVEVYMYAPLLILLAFVLLAAVEDQEAALLGATS